MSREAALKGWETRRLRDQKIAELNVLLKMFMEHEVRAGYHPVPAIRRMGNWKDRYPFRIYDLSVIVEPLYFRTLDDLIRGVHEMVHEKQNKLADET